MVMSDYLSEPTLPEVFPSSMTVNGSVFNLQNTENLTDGVDLVFQWGLYTSDDKWIVRICKPDNSASPTAWLYDQLADTDGTSMNQQEWLLSAVAFSSTLWND